MRWDGFELGPVLDTAPDGELRLAFDLTRRQAVCLRYHAWVAGPVLGPIPQPDSPVANLARVIEVRVEGNEAWVERELCLGPTLETLLGRPMDPRTVAGIASQILEGLRDLHQAGGAHGTLSPAAITFDLTSGRVRLVDLEVARLALPVGADVVAYQNATAGRVPTPSGDLHALGRICESLLRGQASASESAGPGGLDETAAGLWRWSRQCQAAREDIAAAGGSSFGSAEAALAALNDLGLAGAASASLSGGSWARRHASALALLEQWKRSPPLEGAQDTPLTYGQLRSSLKAETWWRRIGMVGVAIVLLSLILGMRPVRGIASIESSFGDEACLERARPGSVAGAPSLEGRLRFMLQVDPGTAVALDGCPLPGMEARSEVGVDAGIEATSEQGGVLVARGLHELRARKGGAAVDRTIDLARQGEGALDVRPLLVGARLAASEEETAALTRFLDTARSMLRDGLPVVEDGGASPFEPLVWGMLEPQAQWLLAEDARVLAHDLDLRSSLPDSLALALDGLRAAAERFDKASLTCREKLRSAATAELASGQPVGLEVPQLIDAAVLMAAARAASVQLADPLQVERRGLDRLAVGRSPMLNRAVDALLGIPDLRGCLEGLLPLAGDVDEMAGRVLLVVEAE